MDGSSLAAVATPPPTEDAELEVARGVWSLVDLGCLSVLAGLTGLAQPHLFAATTLVSLDSVSQFYPWYAFLGFALRSGHIPGWNPAVFSGTPFAANPLSGWTYLPAMALFTLLPLASAARAYLILHPILAGFGTYALARTLGIGRVGALLAGVAYANTGFLQVQNACCFAFASVYSWLPLALLGVELAILSRHWYTRTAGWGLAGLAFSQILAAWLGQGAYYAFMIVGGYVAYRTMLVVPAGVDSRPIRRLQRLVAHGLGVFVFAVALDAAGLLPRLEFNALSNLAGGYTGNEVSVGGLNPKDWILLVKPGFWYLGISVLALAVCALFVTRGPLKHQCAFFGATSLLALLITGTVETPIHWVLYELLPGFARLHPHAPERILTVAYLGPALLAGAAVSSVARRAATWRALRRVPRPAAIAASALVLIVAADLAAAGAKARTDWALVDPLNGADKLTPVDLTTYYQSDAAASFLQAQAAQFPSRYIGYAPDLHGEPWPYSTRVFDPRTAALEVDNRALALGLQDVQGYDASHLGRYDAYMTTLNGRSQNYHDAEVFPNGLRSPLLDLLNVRYLVVPRQPPLEAMDAATVDHFPRTVFADDHVEIRENSSALPRAWVLHLAVQATPNVALADLATGKIDARQTAILQGAPPSMAPAIDPTHDRAVVTLDNPDDLAVSTSSDSPGLLMLSEIDYPAWKAYVDGEPTDLLAADGALRAVPLAAGDHQVELRFESTSLWVGTIISSVALGLLLVFAVLPVAFQRRYSALSASSPTEH